MSTDNSQLLRVKRVVQVSIVSQALLIVGAAADLTTIAASHWFKQLLSLDILKWASYTFNLALTMALIYVFFIARKQERLFKERLENSNSRSSQLLAGDIRLWKRFVRILRSIELEELPSPDRRNALEPMLDELAKRLPDNGAHYKLAIAKPCPDGKFKILAERGMDPSSVFALEQRANWKERRSFFANTLELADDSKYLLFQRGGPNYLDIQRPQGTESRPSSSGSHFIVPIRQPSYYGKLPKNTLALVSIGIPKGSEIDDTEQQEALYKWIYPIVKGIEAILLCYPLVEAET